MGELPRRLKALGSTIEEIMRIAGTVGASIGVMYHGEIIYQENFGFRDVEEKLPVTAETIFPGCSLTKAMICAAIGILVEKRKIRWDSRVKDVLPDFHINDPVLRNEMTVTDILTHRTGMSKGEHYLGSENNLIISISDSLKFIGDQKPIYPFRTTFDYNNLCYELAGHIIDRISGMTWAEVLKDHIFLPLGMNRTFLHDPTGEVENTATSYNTLDDGTPIKISTVKSTDSGFGGASAGVLTCVNDLLKFYKALMHAANDQFESGQSSTPMSVLKNVTHLLSAKVPMHSSTIHEASYALGWGRVQLPGTLGTLGNNPPLMLNGMPIVGKGSSQLVLFHQGKMPGALASVNLIPETNSAIVVMTNSLALNDSPDWISQLILEELLEINDRNDYIRAAKISADETLRWHSNVAEELMKEQKPNTSPQSLENYVGVYWNSSRTVKIVVTREKTLYWAIQGLEAEKFPLSHYEDDTFIWLQSRNELASRGRWVDQPAMFWRLRFRCGENGYLSILNWAHDAELPEGEDFFKEETKYCNKMQA